MLVLQYRDPERLAERAKLAAQDAAFCRHIGKGWARRSALIQNGRLTAVLRKLTFLKILLLGRLNTQKSAGLGEAQSSFQPVEEYPLAIVIGCKDLTLSMNSPTHWVARLPLGKRMGISLFLRWPRSIDARYVILQLLQKRLAQPLLHNRLSHMLQNLPGRRKTDKPPSPSLQTVSRKPLPQNMLYVKLDDITLRHSAEHIRAIADAGFHVNVGLFLFDLQVDDLCPTLVSHPKISVSSHSGGWKHAFWANILGSDPLPQCRLANAGTYQAAFFDQLALQPSKFANLHFYAMQQEAIPHVLNSGQEASFMYTGHTENGDFIPLRGREAASYALGRTDGGLLLVSGEDHNGWRYDPANTWDVLKRTSTLAGRGDVAKGTGRLLRATRNAFDLGMPSILSTHEFRLIRFRPEEVFEMFSGLLVQLRDQGYAPHTVSETELLAQLKGQMEGVRDMHLPPASPEIPKLVEA